MRAFVAKDGDRYVGIALEFDHAPELAEQPEAFAREVRRQLALATRCLLDTGSVELWRAGPAYLAISPEPTYDLQFLARDARIFLEPDAEISLDLPRLGAVGHLFIPPKAQSFHPVVTADDCLL